MIDDNMALQSLLIKDWVEDNIIYFKLQYPNTSEEKLREVLNKVAKKYITNQRVYLHNDYQDDMRVDSDLLTLYDWYQKNRPIAAGNGTFFYSHDKKSSPVQEVIDGRISARKSYQKTRDEYLGPGGDISSYYYQYFDINYALQLMQSVRPPKGVRKNTHLIAGKSLIANYTTT